MSNENIFTKQQHLISPKNDVVFQNEMEINRNRREKK